MAFASKNIYTLLLLPYELDHLEGYSALGTEVYLHCSAVGPMTVVWRYWWLGLYRQVLTMLHFLFERPRRDQDEALNVGFLQELQVAVEILRAHLSSKYLPRMMA